MTLKACEPPLIFRVHWLQGFWVGKGEQNLFFFCLVGMEKGQWYLVIITTLSQFSLSIQSTISLQFSLPHSWLSISFELHHPSRNNSAPKRDRLFTVSCWHRTRTIWGCLVQTHTMLECMAIIIDMHTFISIFMLNDNTNRRRGGERYTYWRWWKRWVHLRCLIHRLLRLYCVLAFLESYGGITTLHLYMFIASF